MNSLHAIPAFFFAILLLGLSACTERGCSGSGSTSAQAKDDETGLQEKAVKVSDFPELNLSGLNDEQKSSLIKLFNDEICPCGCPKTFAQCLQNKKECEPGLLLAKWTLDQLKAGAPERTLFQVLSEEINSGFMSKQVAIKTEGAARKGNPNAPITIVEFADFECPACKIAYKAISKLMEDKGNEIQLYFMHFPLTGHIYAEGAAVAAEAAGRQGKFWEMYKLLFEHDTEKDGPLNDAALAAYGKKLFETKKAFDQYTKDRADTKLLDKVRGNKEYAMTELRIMSTPAFYFNGRMYNLSLAEDGFLLRMAMERAREGISCEQSTK